MSDTQVSSQLVSMECHKGQSVSVPSLLLVVFRQLLVTLGLYVHHSDAHLCGHRVCLSSQISPSYKNTSHMGLGVLPEAQ